jgi:hypothetical protein
MTALPFMNNQAFRRCQAVVSWHTLRAILSYKRRAKRNMLMLMSDQSIVGFLSGLGVVEVDYSSACMLERPTSLVGTACLGVLVVDWAYAHTLIEFRKDKTWKKVERATKSKEMALIHLADFRCSVRQRGDP